MEIIIKSPGILYCSESDDTDLKHICPNPQYLRIIRDMPSLLKEQESQKRLINIIFGARGIIGYGIIDVAQNEEEKTIIKKQDFLSLGQLENLATYQNLLQEKN